MTKPVLIATTVATLALVGLKLATNSLSQAVAPPPTVTFSWRVAPLTPECAALTNYLETWAEWRTNLNGTNAWTRAYPTNRQYRAVTNYSTNVVVLPFLPFVFFRSAYGFKPTP